jgi:phosphonate transport system substrate-binding protein
MAAVSPLSRLPRHPVSCRALAVTGLVLLGAAHAAAQGAPAHLRLGVVAEEANEPDRMLRVYGELLARLRERLAPASVEVGGLAIARDLDDLSQRIARGEVEFVLETVFPTLVLQERSRRLAPGLVVVRRGQRQYRSVFFTRKEGPTHSLEDLRGRTLVLQALRSTSAFALPKAELERAGIPLVPADDHTARRGEVRYVLALAEINQAVWVLHGKGDSGAFNEGDWAALPDRVRSQLRVFHETRPILRGLVSFHSGLDPRVRRLAEDALMGLAADEPGRAALTQAQGITRFEPLTAGDRKELREWAAVLRPRPPR